jgi:ubiquitin-protein ligase
MGDINIRRLAKDIRSIMKEPIENIYYIHDETDMTRGYALIIGPNGTPYSYGYYFFEFRFPSNYPFVPPVVKFCTNDGLTRFNPNLYVCGKVCLSILNTWKGEGWSSCQNIRSVLLSLQCALNDTPLLNEPGITTAHPDYHYYNTMLQYKNIEIAILGIINGKYLDNRFLIFWDKVLEHYRRDRDTIVDTINVLSNKLDDNSINKFSIYSSHYRVNFNGLRQGVIMADQKINRFNDITNDITKLKI